MRKLLLIPVLFFAITSCGHSGNDVEKISEVRLALSPPAVKADEELEVADPGAKDEKGDPNTIRVNEPVGNANTRATNSNTVRDTAKKIIKEGDISFETGNLKETRNAIIASLKKAGGYVSEENESNNSDENRREYVLKVRIPAKYFDGFLNDVSATAAQIDSKNITMRDVTTRYIDMSTRLQNRKLLEARYQALLNRATRMTDILEVEDKLNNIQSEIESEQGQLNYLSRQVAYSSLNITFYTRHIVPVDKGYGVGYKLKRALADGWDTLGLWCYGLISIWPLLLLITALVILFKRWRKRRKAAKAI
jgi:hypothetical protein